VTFETRKLGEGWVSNYIDHESNRWKHVDIAHDEKKDEILVTERGTPRVVLDRQNWTLWADNGQSVWTVPATTVDFP
jgi:hypothetical protein